MSPTMTRHRQSGFTLIDLVIVVAILAVLVAFLLPAVRQARGPARRSQCKNNLKQIGVALHNYYDTHNCFPAGFYLQEQGPYTGWGWAVSLLPYLDQVDTFNKIQFPRGLQQEYNEPHLKHSITSLRCPADPGVPLPTHLAVVTSEMNNGEVALATVDAANLISRSNYFAMVGYLPKELGGIERTDVGKLQENPGRLGNPGSSFSLERRYCDRNNFGGVFGQNSAIKMDDIKDGLSYVVMVGERYSPMNIEPGAIGHGAWFGVPDCSTTAGLAAALGDASVKLNLGATTRVETTGFGSLHNGGANFLLGDGSVRFISDKISVTTYRDLSTIDDGREVGDF